MAVAKKVGKLLDAVRSSGEMYDIELAQELGGLGTDAVPLLIEAIPDFKTRWAAVTALGMIGDPEAIDPIIPICRDSNPTNRGAAVMALAKLGTGEIVPPMMKVIENEESGIVRTQAIQALGEVGGADVEEFLIGVAENPGRDVYDRREATKALGVSGGADATAALGRFAAGSDDEYVRKFAAEALD